MGCRMRPTRWQRTTGAERRVPQRKPGCCRDFLQPISRDWVPADKADRMISHPKDGVHPRSWSRMSGQWRNMANRPRGARWLNPERAKATSLLHRCDASQYRNECGGKLFMQRSDKETHGSAQHIRAGIRFLLGPGMEESKDASLAQLKTRRLRVISSRHSAGRSPNLFENGINFKPCQPASAAT